MNVTCSILRNGSALYLHINCNMGKRISCNMGSELMWGDGWAAVANVELGVVGWRMGIVCECVWE